MGFAQLILALLNQQLPPQLESLTVRGLRGAVVQNGKATCSSASLIFFSNSAIFSEATCRRRSSMIRVLHKDELQSHRPTFARSATIAASLAHFISAHTES